MFSQDHHGGLFTLYDNDMIVTLCLVKLLSYFPILFYYCCGDRIVCVLGSARIILLVIYVYLRCLASPHSCGLLARCPFTCKQGVILRLFMSIRCRDRILYGDTLGQTHIYIAVPVLSN